jgi:tetratricopeptide (TPR) repeat protein
MLEYLDNYQQSANFENGVYDLINYYKSKQLEEDEINTYIKYLHTLHSSYSFLNSYAWRMTELNKNLDDALIKVNEALTLIDNTIPQYPNILDTKAEILWKLGNTEEAIDIIQEAIGIDPSSEYYKAQREKFLNS